MIERGDRETPALDISVILYTHRDPDGWVSFVRKLEKPRIGKDGKERQFENVGAIRTGELPELLPGIFDEFLTVDGYFTIHGFWRGAPWNNALTGLPDAWRKEKYLSRLNACYADIDCGRTENDEPGATLTSLEAQYRVELLAHDGILPQPSMIAHSGRGLYTLWLLRDERNPAIPPKAWEEFIQPYKEINRAIIERLRAHELPADIGAHDAARVLRLPGSVHRKAGKRVAFNIRFDENGRGFFYTLREMAAFFGVLTTRADLPPVTRAAAIPPGPRRMIKKHGSAPARAHGPQRLGALRASDLILIERKRNGFLEKGKAYPDGTLSYGRRRTLGIFASCLRASGANPAATGEALRAMAGNMRPPYPSKPDDPPIEEIVRSVFEAGRLPLLRTDFLCKNLGVTPELARELNLQSIRPQDVAREADRARPLQSELIKKRLEIAREFLEKSGWHTTARKLAKYYSLLNIPGANPQTANMDLNAIGYNTARAAGGRPRKTYKSIK
jgi:hypothetical protein